MKENRAKILQQAKCHKCESTKLLQFYRGQWWCGKCMVADKFKIISGGR